MIIGAIFLAVVAACALVLLVAIVKSSIEDARAVNARARPPRRRTVLSGEREGRFTRERQPVR